MTENPSGKIPSHDPLGDEIALPKHETRSLVKVKS